MRRWLEAGERRFQFLPFFIGPTLAITVYLKQLLRGYAKEYGPLEARVAPFLFNGAGAGDRFIAEILRDQVRAVIAENALARPKVALVDHGTPVAGVNYVRNFVAGQLSVLLGDEVSEVSACSMERREGKRYAFNDPLLEDKLREPNYMAGSVVLAMLFLNPGKHAGPGGDVAQIVEEAIASGEVNPELKVYQSPLLGEHPRMVELLSRRLEQLREMPWMEFTGDNNASESRAAEESAASAS
jgi:hypothetical protein